MRESWQSSFRVIRRSNQETIDSMISRRDGLQPEDASPVWILDGQLTALLAVSTGCEDMAATDGPLMCSKPGMKSLVGRNLPIVDGAQYSPIVANAFIIASSSRDAFPFQPQRNSIAPISSMECSPMTKTS